jgi:predicted enzyme related to lactoylglutathione lyase
MVPKEPDAINGGLFKRSAGDKHPMIVIDVPDVDKHARQVQQAGGKVVMPKVKVGDFGYSARVTDTDGNVVWICRPSDQATPDTLFLSPKIPNLLVASDF